MLSLESELVLLDFNSATYLKQEIEKRQTDMSWFRKDSQEEDEIIVEVNSTIFEALANADAVREIESETGRNLREQLTVEEVMEMEKETRLRGFIRRN